MKFSPVWTVLFAAGSLYGETARELFNPPAREYIVGNTAAASNLVTQALQKYPDDEKLLKLKELIDQQQQQQQNQNQKDQQQQNQEQQPDPSDQTDQPDDPTDQPDPAEQPPEQEQPQQPPRPAGEMTPEEAEQLLDAMRQNEQDKRTDLRPFLGQPVRVEKDW